LSNIAKAHQQTKRELDALYKSIFEGTTPGVPGEDEKEHETNQAEKTFNDMRVTHKHRKLSPRYSLGCR
jgi:hypothetical protein